MRENKNGYSRCPVVAGDGVQKEAINIFLIVIVVVISEAVIVIEF